MKTSAFLRAVLAFTLLTATAAFADEPVARLHKVNAPVGLIIRSKPGTNGKRVGSLEEGTQVTLAGKAVAEDKSKVVPVVSKDAQDPDASWVQISAPKAGYVLYRVGGANPYDYLVHFSK